jgi:hypothetical protein
LIDASGRRLELLLTARTAGEGILHAGYQPENPAAAEMCQTLVDKLLRSFELIRRPLNEEELTKLSKESRK